MTRRRALDHFRELKPGTMDALFDGWAPLRWCLFAEPVNVYRGTPVRLEAVLANEDVLAAGRVSRAAAGRRARHATRVCEHDAHA